MSDATTQELKKLIVRRRQEGGEFCYILTPDSESINGKKQALSKLKETKPEAFSEMKSKCQTKGETDSEFEARLLRIIPVLPYEEKDDNMDVDEDTKVNLSGGDLYKVVSVEGGHALNKAGNDEVESFFQKSKEIKGVDKVKQMARGSRAKGRPDQTAIRQTGGIRYEITFKDEESAKVFLEKEVEFKDQKIKKQFLKDIIQFKIVQGMLNRSFQYNQRITECIPLEKGKEDSYLMVYGIGHPTDDEVKEFFMGVESEFDNIVSIKKVMQKSGATKGAGKLFGLLVEFENKAARNKFTELKDLTFNEKVVKYSILSEVASNNELRRKKVNYMVDDGPTTQELSNRRLIILRTKEEFSPEVEQKLKSIFSETRNIRHCGVDKLTILTFPTADVASKAIRNLADSNGLFNPVTIMQLPGYLETREKLLELSVGRIEKTKTKWENIKNSGVSVDGDVITITTPQKEKKEVKEKAKKDGKKEGTTKKTSVEEKVVKPLPVNPILRKRMNRGKNSFDTFVGVRGFNKHIKNMGKATDMDVCNYFIHNHKDVADVKFVNWTDIVFAKFKSMEAAEKFISLSYHMFYGVDLTLHDVPEFLKKKTDQQKDEVSRVLLGKKFNQLMMEGNKGAVVTNGAATNGTDVKPELELAAFASKQAGAGIRDLLIENLHLDKDDVGQPKWMKGNGDAFKARIPIKLDANAIGYLVKKWNDLEITVAGETVKAELSSGPLPKQGGGAAKRGRKRFNHPASKRAKISLEDY